MARKKTARKTQKGSVWSQTTGRGNKGDIFFADRKLQLISVLFYEPAAIAM
jgi:hypothetical protein